MKLKETPLYQRHLQYNGRIINFGGWALPLEYGSVLNEAKAVRSFCGLFDASHMGEIIVRGKGALEFLQRLTPNDLSLIKEGEQQYNLLLNTEGGVIDDLMIYNRKSEFLCVVNASNKDKVYAWFKENEEGEVEVIDESEATALICLQGPTAFRVMGKIFGENITDLKYLSFVKDRFEGKEVFISRSGYTGEDGFEIYTSGDDAGFFWDKLVDAGKSLGLKLCGLGSRDILRIEAGFPLYGHEIDDTTNPYEATLGWVVKLDKDFIAKEKIVRVRNEGIKRKRVGFIMQERALVRQGYPVYSGEKEVGRVSSGAYSPNLDKFIGMAYVKEDYADSGTEIEIKVRNKLYKAKVAKFPFINPKTKKIKVTGRV